LGAGLKRSAFGYCQDFRNVVHIRNLAWPKVDRARLKVFARSHWSGTLNTFSQHEID